jgi:hypothetical protein
MALETAITNVEKILCTLMFTGPSGRPAAVQPGSLEISTSSGDGTFDRTQPLTLPDGTQRALQDNEFWCVSGDAISADTVGDGTVDADVGPGVVPLGFQVVVHVSGEQATGVAASFGPRVQK